MGQDSEEAAEFVVTVRNEHVKMKEWYNSSHNHSPVTRMLQDKYGPYPSMWKEVLNWPGWKETRKEYLKAMQQQENRPGGVAVKIESDTNNNGTAGKAPRKRKSRWGKAASEPSNGQSDPPVNKRFAPLPPVPSSRQPPRVVLPSMSSVNTNLTQQQQQDLRTMQAKLRAVNDRLENLEVEAARVDALPREHRDRSPSPPPIYGADGKRKNTRAVRWRERYTAERQDLLESIMRLSNKGNVGPVLPTGAASLLVRRRVKKIRVPVEEHPNYNFIGLIIGPRGKTQKELEAKTGCKIAIRGRGSVKEGARGRRDGKVMDGDNEPLHVVISGDDQRAVDAASEMIEQMLVVIDDEKNVHKQQQLRELALLNGTLKENDAFCEICGEKGHRSFECPKRFLNKGAMGGGIKCAICGDTSHPTRDCTRRNLDPTNPAGGDANQQGSEQKIDSEYLSFMAELDGKKANQPANEPTSNDGGDKLPPLPPNGSLPPLPPAPEGPPPLPPSAVSTTSGTTQPPRPAAHAPNSLYGNFQPEGSMAQPHQQQQQQQQYNQQAGYGAGYNNQQYQYGSYGPQSHQQQPQQAAPPPQQQQQAATRVKPGEETAGWDPSSYYGSYDNGGGGFNWW